MKLIIAEKPELGRDIARAVCGAKGEVRLPYTGGGYMVVNCIGHLLGWAEPAKLDPDAYGDRRDVSALPILLEPWPQVPDPDKTRALENIKRGLAVCDGVIHAGDPDDEGQFLVDEVLDFLGYTGPVERVYVNDNLEKNIRRAFENLRDNAECRGDGEAAAARSIADFCFGINESRLISARTGGAAAYRAPRRGDLGPYSEGVPYRAGEDRRGRARASVQVQAIRSVARPGREEVPR